MPDSMRKLAAQRQIVAKIKPVRSADGGATFNDYFTQVSGGEISASVEKVYHGQSLFPETLCAPAEIGDITVTGYISYHENFLTKLQTLRQLVGRIYYDITVQVFDCDLAVPGTDRFYSKALLVGLSEGEGDAASGTPATFALTFSISTVSVPTS